MRHFLFCFLLFSFLHAEETTIIGVQTLDYFDAKRERPVRIELWYPTNDEDQIDEQQWHLIWHYPTEIRNATISDKKESYPLIIMSHGNMGDRRDRSWFAEELVNAGFIVASIDHHGNTWDNNGPMFHLQPWDRPLDISFTIDKLLEDPIISPFIDAGKIGFSGFSLGGMTGLWLAGARIRNQNDNNDSLPNQMPDYIKEQLMEMIDLKKIQQSFEDKRIKAFFLMVPVAWEFSLESLKEIAKPIHIIGLVNDQILNHDYHSSLLFQNIPTSELTLFDGQEDHFVFLNRITEYGSTILHPCLHQDHPYVDRKEVHDKTAIKAKLFFKSSFNNE